MAKTDVLKNTPGEIPLHLAINLAHEIFELGSYDVGVPYIIGKPGGGKTRMISQYFEKDLGWGFLAYEPALERLEKFGGIPEVQWMANEKSFLETTLLPTRSGENISQTPITIKREHELHTQWSVPQMICEINEKSKKHDRVCVLLDDWHLCDEDRQTIGFELFTHRSLNGCKIPDNVHFILAGNATSAAGARLQLSAIMNRCYKIPTCADVSYWLEHYAEPQNLLPVGISFFQNNSNKDLFHEEESTSEQFGSPRSWTYLLRLLEQLQNSGRLSGIYSSKKPSDVMIGTKLKQSVCRACVSGSAASAFYNYMEIFEKVDVKKLFVKGQVDIPSDRVDQYAYMAAMASEYYHLECEHFDPTKNKSDAEINKQRGYYIDLLKKFVGEGTNMELLACTFRMLATKQENKSLYLRSGSDIVYNLIRDKRMPTEVTGRFKNLTKQITSQR